MAIPTLPTQTGYTFKRSVEHPNAFVGFYDLDAGDAYRMVTFTKDGNLTELDVVDVTYTFPFATFHKPLYAVCAPDDVIWAAHGSHGIESYTIDGSGNITRVQHLRDAVGSGGQDVYGMRASASYVGCYGNGQGWRWYTITGVGTVNSTPALVISDGAATDGIWYNDDVGIWACRDADVDTKFYDDNLAEVTGLKNGNYFGVAPDSNFYMPLKDDNKFNFSEPRFRNIRYGVEIFNDLSAGPVSDQIENWFTTTDNPYEAIIHDSHGANLWGWFRMRDTGTGYLIDTSGKKRDMTLTGNYSIVDPIFNTHKVDNTTDGALFSNDRTCYASKNAAEWANGNADFTISAWFRLDDFTNYQEILNANNGGSGGQVVLMADWTSGRLWAGRYTGTWQGAYYNNLEPGRMYHAVFTYSNTQGIKLYVDGVLRAQNSDTGNLSATQTHTEIGREVYHDQNTAPLGEHRLNGAIGEVVILTKNLTPAEVLELYNEGLDNPRVDTYDQQILDLSPRAFFPCDDYGGNLMDLSGNAYFLKANNASQTAATYRVAGQVGPCLFINGDLDNQCNFFGSTPAPSLFPVGTNEFAFDVWMKDEIQSSPGATYTRFFEIGASDLSGTERFWFGSLNESFSTADQRRRIYAGTDQWSPVVPPEDYSLYNNQRGNGTWHHYAVNYDATNQKIQWWIDAQLVAEHTGVSITASTKALSLYLGNIGTATANVAPKAYFQKLAVYDTMLTQEQVTANYEKGKDYTVPAALNKYEQTIYDDEPFSYWPLDEIAGGACQDRYNRIYLVIQGGSADTMTTTGLISGEAQPCLSFNGTSQYLLANSALAQSQFSELTLEALVSTNRNTGNRQDIFGVSESGGYVLDISTSGKANIHIRTRNSGGSFFGPTDDDHVVATGQPYHIGAVYDGRYLRLYVNGIFRGEYDFGGNSKIDWTELVRLTIGAQYGQTADDRFFDGKISHVAMYNKALPNAEERFRKRFLLAIGIDNDAYDDRTDYEKVVVDDAPLMFYNITDRRAAHGVVYDMMNNYYGDISGSPSVVTGAVPGSGTLNFDGIDDHIKIDDGQFLSNITDKLSYEIWVKSDSANGYRGEGQTPNDIGAIMFRRDSFGFHPSGAGTWTNQINCYINTTAESWGVVTIIVPNTNQWHHIALTWDGVTGDLKAYLDGVLHDQELGLRVGTMNQNSSPGDGALYIASDAHSVYPSRKFDGELDMAAVYDLVLTDEQILEHYVVGRENQFPPISDYRTLIESHPNLIHYWPMDDLSTASELLNVKGGIPWVPTNVTREVTGQIGNGIHLPGTDADCRITGDESLMLDNTPAWTVEAWLKVPAGGTCTIVRGRDGVGAGWSFFVSFSAGNVYFTVVFTNNGTLGYNTSIIPTSFMPDTWYHIACVAKSTGRIEVHINGARYDHEETSNSVLRQSTYGWDLGHTLNSDAFYEGYYDEIAIYDTNIHDGEIQDRVKIGFGLEAAEIESDAYTALAPIHGATNYRYWKLNEPHGPVFLDTGLGGSATRAFSHVGSLSGVTFGEPSIVPTSTRTCVKFHGIDDESTRFRAGILGFNSRFFFSFWIKPEASAEGFIMSMNAYFADDPANFPFQIGINPGGYLFVQLSQGNDYSHDMTVGANTRIDQVNHVAFYFSEIEDVAELWINGLLAASATPTFVLSGTGPNTSGQTLCIGAPSFGFGAGADTKYLRDCWLSDIISINDQVVNTTSVVREQYETGMGLDDYNAQVNGDSPQARWRLDEASGTQLSDDSNNFHITNVGNRTFGGPPLHKGSSGSVAITDRDLIDASGYTTSLLASRTVYSIEMWINPNSAVNGGYLYAESQTGGLIMQVQYASNGSINTTFHDGSDWADAVSTGVEQVPSNQTSHVVYTRSGRTAKIYINGRLVVEGDHGATRGDNGVSASSNRATLGCNPHTTQVANGFTGWIDGAAVYYDVLTDQEIKDHFDAGFLGTNYEKVIAETNAYLRLPMNDALSGNKTIDVIRNIEFAQGGTASTTDSGNGYDDRCLYFNGNSTVYNDNNNWGNFVRAEIADLVGFSMNSSFTVTAWIKPSLAGKTNGDNNSCLMAMYNQNNNDRIYCLIYWDAPNSNFTMGGYHIDGATWNSVGNGVGAARIIPDVWNHVTFRFDYSGGNCTVSLFIDGQELVAYNNPQTFVAGTLDFGTAPMTLGETAVSSTSYYHYDGLMDEFMVHERALSDQEILDLYNGMANEYQMTGSVTQDTIPVERQVYVYRRSDGVLVDQTTSVGGTFDIRWREVYPDTEYFIVVLDDAISPDLQPIAQDRLVPTLVT